jgi:hypothetical protein
MANTCERMRKVARHYSLSWVPVAGELHHYFDRLDSLAGIQTRHPGACVSKRGRTCNHQQCRESLYVGERLLHHEARVADVHYHFWLGDDGVN